MAEDGEATYEALRSTSAWRVVARDGLVVSGPGALEWLQGQLSQDLSSLRAVDGPAGIEPPGGVEVEAGDATASVDTLVLSPQGKIDSLCRVSALGADRLLLDLRAGFGEALCTRLRRFKLRVKADIEPVEDLRALQVRGPLLPKVADLLSLAAKGAVAVLDVSWPLWSGRDLLFRGDRPDLSQARALLGSGPGDPGAFEAVRIEAGVPELGLELTDRTIPQEAGGLVEQAVSFSKGCYTGQELVARVDARGSNTARRLRGVVIDAGARSQVPVAGDELIVQDATVGQLTSVAFSPGYGAFVALAYVKRATKVPSEARTSGGGEVGHHGQIRALPLLRG
ncbi:MAG: CAF17-like 4Fe-4S cluster assembly/insertion protein YgfZ [Acidimicrobiales bacterium]